MKFKGIILYSLLAGLFVAGLDVYGDGATNDVTQSTGDGHTAEQNSAIREFKFEGVGLGATFSEVKAKYPNMIFQKEQSDSDMKLAVWSNEDIKTADGVIYGFLNGKLFQIEVVYEPDTLNKIGGYNTIYDRLVSKYGKEDENSPNAKYICDYKWQFYDVRRYVSYSIKSESHRGFLFVADAEVARKIFEARKAKADVGF